MYTADQFNVKYIVAISLTSALGGFLFGYDWVVIGGAKPFYERFFEISELPNLQGWAMSCALVGCIIGAVAAGKIAERFGRKKPLALSAFLFVLSAAGTGWFDSFEYFIAFRILGGVGIGLASTVSPMYIAEISPAPYRGRLVSLNQLAIVIGILAAQITNFLIAKPVPVEASNDFILNSWNGQSGWRFMFWAELVPATAFLILVCFIPDSPRWLLKNGQEERSLKILSAIGGKNYAQKSQNEIRKSLKNIRRVKLNKLLKGKNRHLIVYGVTLAFMQQWCGINVVFNYAEEVFAAAGYGVSDALFNIILTGVVNLIFTLFAIKLIDKWGRRILWLLGSAGLVSCYLLIGLFYFYEVKGFFLVILIIAAIAIYALSLAPIFWVLVSEIFPNKIRGISMSIATTALWVASFLITYSFPILNRLMNTSGTFWLFGCVCVLCFVFVKYRIPETKNKSLEEIESMFDLNR